jgi:hypothetical protein
MAQCLICGAKVSHAATYCNSCGTVQPQRRLGGTIALAVLVGAMVVACVAAILI